MTRRWCLGWWVCQRVAAAVANSLTLPPRVSSSTVLIRRLASARQIHSWLRQQPDPALVCAVISPHPFWLSTTLIPQPSLATLPFLEPPIIYFFLLLFSFLRKMRLADADLDLTVRLYLSNFVASLVTCTLSLSVYPALANLHFFSLPHHPPPVFFPSRHPLLSPLMPFVAFYLELAVIHSHGFRAFAQGCSSVSFLQRWSWGLEANSASFAEVLRGQFITQTGLNKYIWSQGPYRLVVRRLQHASAAALLLLHILFLYMKRHKESMCCVA